MILLTREELYKRLGQALRNAREKRGLSRATLAEQLEQIPGTPERHLRKVGALSVMAGHILRQTGLSRKQVAERANLPVELVRKMEAGEIWNAETYSIYCLAYGLRTAYRTFEKKSMRYPAQSWMRAKGRFAEKTYLASTIASASSFRAG